MRNQSPDVPGSAPQESARCADFSKDDRVFVSCSNPSTPPRTRQVADLFQPATSSAPPAVTVTDQPVTPTKELDQDRELLPTPARQPGYVRGARRWASQGAALVVGTPGAVVALVASAALVLVVGGITMSTTSSSTELPVTGLAPSRLPAPVKPVVSDEHPATVAPIDTSAGFAQQAPAQAYSSDAHSSARTPTAFAGSPSCPASSGCSAAGAGSRAGVVTTAIAVLVNGDDRRCWILDHPYRLPRGNGGNADDRYRPSA